MRPRYLLLFILTFFFRNSFCQQDMDLHLAATFLNGKNVIKVKRDFHDPYLWVLAQNNQVYRINSLTSVVDDYTPQFNAYNNFQFTDIAGRSGDTVFVATNSNNLLEYKKGIFKVINQSNGLIGTINQIGVDHFYEPLIKYPADPLNGLKLLMIGTSNNFYYYDMEEETIILGSVRPSANTLLFETTYRTEAYSNFGFIYFPDPVRQHPTINQTVESAYSGALYYNAPEFGYNLNTAYYTTASYFYNPGNTNFGYVDVLYMNQIWGTEKGLFLNNEDRSYFITTSPYGHYLDGIKVNKITSIYGLTGLGTAMYKGLLKENLLIGTDQGLYFSNSSYQNYIVGALNTYNTFTHQDAIGTKVINDICVNATSYSTTVCEDGVWVAANGALYLLKSDYGTYLSTAQLAQSIQFNGQNSTTNTFQLCANTSAKATINSFVYGGNNVQWYKDGLELANESGSSLNITQAGDYNAVLYDPCSGLHVESNHLKVTIITAPVFTFNYPDQLSFCDGTTATLQTDNNSLYQYRWYKDGVLNSNTTPTLNTTQSGKYRLEVSACAGTWVTSKEVEIDFIKIQPPVITADKASYCAADEASLSTNFVNDGTSTLNWFLNGNLLAGNQNKIAITTNQPGAYTVSINNNVITCNQVSIPFNLIFSPIPSLNIQQIINTSLCDGQTVQLKANYSGGTIKWSTGETTDVISVKQSGTYSGTVTSSSGCTFTESSNVLFFNNPTLNLADATLCQFTNQTITLTAPAGFAKYEWNGISGEANFSTNKLGAVNLTVTDFNGCMASQTINITSHCDDIHIPNAFTPNGDGINDNWVIGGLEGDLTTTVKVFDRSGALLFQSIGYPVPWNGLYKNKKLPAGVYYYIINARGSNQVLSGSLTIIY